MSTVALIARREFQAYFRSPLGPLVIAVALLVDGIYFYWFGLSEKKLSAEVLSTFFYGISGVTMMTAPVIAMRLIAEERQTGSITLLNTAPVKDVEIVLGKYLSAFAMVLLITALSAYMPLLIFVNGKVSAGHILVGYLGVALLGSATIAIGLLGSALARSQVVAVIIAAVMMAPLVLLWGIARASEPPVTGFLARLSLHHDNFRPFMNGVLQVDRALYYVAMTFFFLLGATKVLEARRWR